MKTYKCEEMMCEGCVNRIKKGLDGAGIKNTVDLSVKTVTIDGIRTVRPRQWRF